MTFIDSGVGGACGVSALEDSDTLPKGAQRQGLSEDEAAETCQLGTRVADSAQEGTLLFLLFGTEVPRSLQENMFVPSGAELTGQGFKASSHVAVSRLHE